MAVDKGSSTSLCRCINGYGWQVIMPPDEGRLAAFKLEGLLWAAKSRRGSKHGRRSVTVLASHSCRVALQHAHLLQSILSLLDQGNTAI